MAQPDLNVSAQNFLTAWLAAGQRYKSTSQLLALAQQWGLDLQGADPISRAASLDAWLSKHAGKEINFGGNLVFKIEEQPNLGGGFKNWLITSRTSFLAKHLCGID